MDPKGKGRAQAEAEEFQLGHTWKNLCRISLNWQTGSAHTTRLIPSLNDPHLGPVPYTPHASSTIVRFHRSLLFTASRARSGSSPPPVKVYYLKEGSQPLGSLPSLAGHIKSTTLDFTSSSKVGVSEIRVDERCEMESSMNELPFSGRHSLLLAVFYTTGQFSLFQISLPLSCDGEDELEFVELYSSSELLVRSGSDEMHHQAAEVARLHYPLLVTCSTDFLLRFYELRSGSGGGGLEVRKLRLDMRSQTCYWPLSLSLAALEPSSDCFRLTIVYPMPFYPSAWTVGLQEFEITLSPLAHLTSTHHATALPFETSKLTRSSSRPRLKLGPVSGIEYADPMVIVARADNTLDLFEYQRPAHELSHRRTLFGHTSRVAAVALNSAGRCVSAGQDGLHVWELTEGDQRSGPVRVPLSRPSTVEWIGFDSEKIVGVLKAEMRTTWAEEEEEGEERAEEVTILSFA